MNAIRFCLSVFFCLATSSAFAAAPKSTILKFQKKAPEALEIEVTEVQLACKQTKTGSIMQYAVTAKVTAVTRSKSKVKVGDVITIFYSNPSEPEPGDFPGEVVKGSRYKGFLKYDSAMKLYVPAAMSGSFEKVKQ